MALTITEALAEIKTIGKRLESKRASVGGYLARQENVRDPLEKEGGATAFIAKERQGIKDLEERIVTLRRAIRVANESTTISIGSETRSISDWLTFRREVAPGRKTALSNLRQSIHGVREQAKRQGLNVAASAETAKYCDVIVNINETELATEIESLETILGTLDGQLSLKNATTIIVE